MLIWTDCRLEDLPRPKKAARRSPKADEEKEAGGGMGMSFPPALLAALDRDPGLRMRLLEALGPGKGDG